MRTYILFLVFFLMIAESAESRILYSRGNYTWEQKSGGNFVAWSLSSGGTSCNCVPSNSDTINILLGHQITVTSNIKQNPNSATLRIHVFGDLRFDGGKLTVSGASELTIYDGGSMYSQDASASDQLVFENRHAWKGNEGAVTGPSCLPDACPTILNVHFLDFRTVSHKGLVELHWKTTHETNNLRFVIQRSNDGVNFSDIEEMRPEVDNEYMYEDNNLPDAHIVYYRIMQQDADGKKVYSMVKPAHLHHIEMEEIYPNPAANLFRVAYYAEEEQIVKIEILDMAGRIVKIDAKKAYPGHNSYEYTTAALGMKKGMYIVKLISEESAEVSQRHFMVNGN